MFNVNTITKSSTMFSRRVYEGLATGCSIISTPSIGIEEKFKDIVFISNSKDDTSRILKHILIDSNIENLSFKGYRKVIKDENYNVRFIKILDTAHIQYHKDENPLISVISYFTEANTFDNFKNFIKCINDQSYSNLVITIFVQTQKIINSLQKISNKNILFILNKDEEETLKLMKNIYIANLNINATYDKEFINDSLLPFLYIDSSIKIIGGVNRYSYNYISEPNEYASFYKMIDI